MATNDNDAGESAERYPVSDSDLGSEQDRLDLSMKRIVDALSVIGDKAQDSRQPPAVRRHVAACLADRDA